jgi:diguanylate cyclase (GGDEF)-like protein
MSIIKTIQSLDVYIFSLALLAIIGIKALRTPKNNTLQAKTFSTLILLTGLIIIADVTTVLFDGNTAPGVRWILQASVVFGYTFQSLICLFWFWYVREVVLPKSEHPVIAYVMQAIPAIACVIIAAASCRTGWLFRYSDSNAYSRGPLFPLAVGISLLYLFSGYCMAIRYRKNIDRRVFIALLCFALPPAIGGIIQTFLYGISLLWPGMTFSLLIIFLAIQNESISLDYLTGINNRQSFDAELARKIAAAKNGKPFAVMLLDIDNFQNINDRLGHMEGDKALIRVARILTAFFQTNGFVARYGGDEFAVIVDIVRVNDLSWHKLQLHNRIEEANRASRKGPAISLSIGCASYMPNDTLTSDQYLTQIHNLLRFDQIVPGERRFNGKGRR